MGSHSASPVSVIFGVSQIQLKIFILHPIIEAGLIAQEFYGFWELPSEGVSQILKWVNKM